MLNKKNVLEKFIFIIAGLVLILGTFQIYIYIPSQIEVMNNAKSQGVASELVSEYFWQQVMPQILTYVINTVGFVFTILSVGMLHSKLDTLISKSKNNDDVFTNTVSSQQDNNDNVLDDFELVTYDQQ